MTLIHLVLGCSKSALRRFSNGGPGMMAVYGVWLSTEARSRRRVTFSTFYDILARSILWDPTALLRKVSKEMLCRHIIFSRCEIIEYFSGSKARQYFQRPMPKAVSSIVPFNGQKAVKCYAPWWHFLEGYCTQQCSVVVLHIHSLS